jgi:alcohol/geraniol dehydrogenase (NADP+)
MAQIQGLAAHAAGAELLPFRYDPGKLGLNEVEIAVTHCGICRSDLHLIANDWGISRYPFIPGHEIIGTVAAVGTEVKGLEIGQRVGLGWQSNSCGRCEWCTSGQENLCPYSEGTCVHRHGGYADRVRANARFVVPIPEALASDTAAPLLCGGITVYNPLRVNGINPSSRVGVVGIGGLGHLAIQFARVFGAEVFAFSTSASKEEEARSLGAHHFINSRETKSMKDVAGALDFLITTVNADQDWGTFLGTLRPNGALWFVGVPPSPLSIHAFPLISGNRLIGGNPIGSPAQIREMLDVAARHGVKATIESFPMSKANDAIEKVKKSKVRYRAVLAN